MAETKELKLEDLIGPVPQDSGQGEDGGEGQDTQSDTVVEVAGERLKIPSNVRAARNNNPLNLRPVGETEGFQEFETPEEGLKAGLNEIEIAKESDLNLREFILEQTPPEDNNPTNPIDQPPSQFTKDIASIAGADPGTPVSQIDPEQLANAQIKMETGATTVDSVSDGEDTDDESIPVEQAGDTIDRERPGNKKLEELENLIGPVASSSGVEPQTKESPELDLKKLSDVPEEREEGVRALLSTDMNQLFLDDDVVSSLGRGAGQGLMGFGLAGEYASKQLGLDETTADSASEALTDFGKSILKNTDIPERVEHDDWMSSLTDPEWWARNATGDITSSMMWAAPGLTAAALEPGPAGEAAAAGIVSQVVRKGLANTLVGTPLESAIEAGFVMEETGDSSAANQAFFENAAVLGTSNFLEGSLLFAPLATKPGSSAARRVLNVGGRAMTQGTQENLTERIQEGVIQPRATGEGEAGLRTSRASEAGLMGQIMGTFMAGGAGTFQEIMGRLDEKAMENLDDSTEQRIRDLEEELAQDISEEDIQDGLNVEAVARVNAFETVAQEDSEQGQDVRESIEIAAAQTGREAEQWMAANVEQAAAEVMGEDFVNSDLFVDDVRGQDEQTSEEAQETQEEAEAEEADVPPVETEIEEVAEEVAQQQEQTPQVDFQEGVDENGINFIRAEDDDSQGEVLFQENDDRIRVVRQSVDPDLQGQGIGTELLTRAAERAIDSGKELISDVSVTQEAADVYENLEEQGFNVEQNPEVEEVEVAGGRTTALSSPNNEPVFRVQGRQQPDVQQSRESAAESLGVDEETIEEFETGEQPIQETDTDRAEVEEQGADFETQQETQQERVMTREERVEQLKKDRSRQPDIEKEATGSQSEVFTDSASLETNWAVVEGNQVRTSSDSDFAISLQPRTDSAKKRQNLRKKFLSEEKFTPARIGKSTVPQNGSPIVDEQTSTPIAGHLRADMIKELYRRDHPNADRYVEWMKSFAETDEVNIDPSIIENMDQPVLVRVAQEGDNTAEEVATVAEESNDDLSGDLQDQEEAIQKSLRIDMSKATNLKYGSQNNEVDIRQNSSFLNHMKEDVLDDTEIDKLFKEDGSTTSDGEATIKNIIMARAFEQDADFLKIALTQTKKELNINRLVSILREKSADFLRAKALTEQGTLYDRDPTADIKDAVKAIKEIRDSNIKIDAYLDQLGLFGMGEGPTFRPFVKDLVAVLHEHGNAKNRLRAIIDNYIGSWEGNSKEQSTLINDTDMPESEQLFINAVRSMEREFDQSSIVLPSAVARSFSQFTDFINQYEKTDQGREKFMEDVQEAIEIYEEADSGLSESEINSQMADNLNTSVIDHVVFHSEKSLQSWFQDYTDAKHEDISPENLSEEFDSAVTQALEDFKCQ